jgi:hypothetical protein
MAERTNADLRAKQDSRDPLDWYRSEICGKHGHTHGATGEWDCLVGTLARMPTRPSGSSAESPA